MEAIEGLRRATEQTGRIVGGVKPGQMAQPTPCAEWDVKALLNHTINATRMFAAAGRREPVDTAAFEADVVGDDPAGAYAVAAAELDKALGEADVLQRMWDM